MTEDLRRQQKKETRYLIKFFGDCRAMERRYKAQLMMLVVGALLLLVKVFFVLILGIALALISLAVLPYIPFTGKTRCPKCGYIEPGSDEGSSALCPKCYIRWN